MTSRSRMSLDAEMPDSTTPAESSTRFLYAPSRLPSPDGRRVEDIDPWIFVQQHLGMNVNVQAFARGRQSSQTIPGGMPSSTTGAPYSDTDIRSSAFEESLVTGSSSYRSRSMPPASDLDYAFSSDFIPDGLTQSLQYGPAQFFRNDVFGLDSTSQAQDAMTGVLGTASGSMDATRTLSRPDRRASIRKLANRREKKAIRSVLSSVNGRFPVGMGRGHRVCRRSTSLTSPRKPAIDRESHKTASVSSDPFSAGDSTGSHISGAPLPMNGNFSRSRPSHTPTPDRSTRHPRLDPMSRMVNALERMRMDQTSSPADVRGTTIQLTTQNGDTIDIVGSAHGRGIGDYRPHISDDSSGDEDI